MNRRCLAVDESTYVKMTKRNDKETKRERKRTDDCSKSQIAKEIKMTHYINIPDNVISKILLLILEILA